MDTVPYITFTSCGSCPGVEQASLIDRLGSRRRTITLACGDYRTAARWLLLQRLCRDLRCGDINDIRSNRGLTGYTTTRRRLRRTRWSTTEPSLERPDSTHGAEGQRSKQAGDKSEGCEEGYNENFHDAHVIENTREKRQKLHVVSPHATRRSFQFILEFPVAGAAASRMP